MVVSVCVCVCVCGTVLHANKLSHTDLKPENILFVNSDSEVIDVIRPGKSKKVSNVLVTCALATL